MAETPTMTLEDAASFLMWFETSAKQAMGQQNEQGLLLLQQLMENSFMTFRAANMVLYVECDRLCALLAQPSAGDPTVLTPLTRFMWMQFKASSLIESMQLFAAGIVEIMQRQATAPDDPKVADAFAGALAAAQKKEK